jgi:hypothetical protein
LIIQNIKDRQGDEIIRCVPLLQALLDFNPQIEITLITGRSYFFAHRRIAVVSASDRARIEELLRNRFDTIVDFFEPVVPEANHDPSLEAMRTVLARSRNHLLFHALDDEDWALWMDVDVIGYPADMIERLLATGKDIVQPHCVLDYGGASFDRNAWRDKGAPEGGLVHLDAVGGTMLMVRADLQRDGLVFPAYPYGRANPCARDGRTGEIETEGLGIMAGDMGHLCWGMQDLEIRHRKL